MFQFHPQSIGARVWECLRLQTCNVTCFVFLQYAYFTTSMHVKPWSKKRPGWKCHFSLQMLSCCLHQSSCFYFLSTILPSFSQGVPVEFLCRPPSAGFDLDVCGARDDRQALHPLSDPLCCLRLTAGFCHCNGALCPTERGNGSFEVIFLSSMIFVYMGMQSALLLFTVILLITQPHEQI